MVLSDDCFRHFNVRLLCFVRYPLYRSLGPLITWPVFKEQQRRTRITSMMNGRRIGPPDSRTSITDSSHYTCGRSRVNPFCCACSGRIGTKTSVSTYSSARPSLLDKAGEAGRIVTAPSAAMDHALASYFWRSTIWRKVRASEVARANRPHLANLALWDSNLLDSTNWAFSDSDRNIDSKCGYPLDHCRLSINRFEGIERLNHLLRGAPPALVCRLLLATESRLMAKWELVSTRIHDQHGELSGGRRPLRPQ